MTPAELDQIVTSAVEKAVTRPHTVPPKRNGPSWDKIASIVLAILVTVGGILVSYVFVTKNEAVAAHSLIQQRATETYETKAHAKEVHDRHEKDSGKVQRKLDAIYHNVLRSAARAGVPRRSLDTIDDDGD